MKQTFIHSLQTFSLLALIITLSVFAMYEAFIPQEKENLEWEQNIMFLLDVSQSMYVHDLDGNNRLKAAKEGIYNVINAYPGWNYSLWIFAGESQRIIPFTQDTWLFLTVLHSLDSKNIAKQWTRLDLALEDGIQSFWNNKSWSIILFTDSDENELILSPELLTLLSNKNIKTYIIWVWTEQWGYIPTGDTFAPIKFHNGKPLVVWLNREWLQKLARDIWGEYMDFWALPDLNYIQTSKNRNNIPTLFLLSLVFWCVYLGTVYIEKYRK